MNESTTRPLKVLIIDDNKNDRYTAKASIKDSFRNTAIDFIEVETLNQGLDRVSKERFDLIVCDGCLNQHDVCDGDQIVTKAREESSPNAKTAFMARSSSVAFQNRMVKAGADVSIDKDDDLSDDPQHFAKTVSSALVKAAERDPEEYKGLEDLLRQAKMKSTPIPGSS